MAHKFHEDGKGTALRIMKRAIREIEAGHTPKFFMIIYPPIDDDTDCVLGLNSHEIEDGKRFSDLLDKAQEGLQDCLLIKLAGINPEDMKAAHEQFARDVERASERAMDRIVHKDKPITDTKQAEELLAKLREKK